MENNKRVIAVDLDGTLWEDDYPNIGKVKTHVVNMVKMWKEQGHKIVIWTCRSEEEQIEQAKAKLAELGIEYDKFNENVPNQYGGDPRKVYCDIYLDDKAINVMDIDGLDINTCTFRNHDLDIGFLLDIIRDVMNDWENHVYVNHNEIERIEEIARAYDYEEVFHE